MINYADRVKETTTTTGTGTLTLGGPAVGFRSFASAFSNNDEVHYAVTDGDEWEVGVGVFSGSTLTRATVLASSNANALVSFGPGQKEVFSTLPGQVVEDLVSRSFPLTAASLETPLVLRGRRLYTVPPASGRWALPPPAQSGHVEGGSLEVLIPVGNATDVEPFPDVYNVTGETFEPAKPYRVVVEKVPGGFEGRTRAMTAAEAVAPTLVSATAVTGSSQMTLVFLEKVFVADLSLLTPSFTAGTPRTITSIASGQNTTTVVLNLSGAISGGSIATLSVAAGGVIDGQGNALAPVVNQPVVVDYALTGLAVRVKASTATGDPISAFVDSQGTVSLVQGTGANQADKVVADPLFNGKDSADFDGNDFYTGAQTSNDSTEYCIFFPALKFDDLTGDQTILNGASTAGGDPNNGILIARQSGNLLARVGDGGGGTNQAAAAFSSTAVFDLMVRINATTIRMDVNGSLFASFTGTVNPVAIAQWYLGRLSNVAVWFFNGRIAEMQIARSTDGSAFSANDPVAAHAWADVEYMP